LGDFLDMFSASFRKTDFMPQKHTPAAGIAEAPEKKIIIAVDGPAASGKGTLARRLAERLGYAYLDTGALYRAVGLAVIETGGNPSSWADVSMAVDIIRRNLTPELLANPALRSPEVSDAASKVAAIPEVREALLDYQREFAQNPPGTVGGVVLDGRDIGTVICPQADIKFFVTATVEERARRRYEELKETSADKGATTNLAQVLADVKRRDERDQTRSIAPTTTAVDAYVLDTTTLNPAATLDEAINVIRSRFLSETNDNRMPNILQNQKSV
jgi:CMP/dCMP kinase